MKITPISGPSTGTAQTSGPTVSADRREAAKQAFLGETKTTITPSDTPIDPQLEKAQASIRKIKMRTNYSTNRDEQPAQAIAEPVASATPHDNVQTTPVPEVTAPISPQLAAIAKQRRALQVKEGEIKAREKALADQSQNGIDLAKLKDNPLSVLQQAGVTYEQLTEAILSDKSGITPELQALQAKVDALEKGLDTKLTERDTQAEQQVLTELQREANKLVADGDSFEMIREHKMQPKVVDLIHRTWKKTGDVMDVEEAANLIETELLNDALRIVKLQKVQSKLTPVEPIQQTAPRQPIRTLTNRDVASTLLSPRARAIAAFNGTLKK